MVVYEDDDLREFHHNCVFFLKRNASVDNRPPARAPGLVVKCHESRSLETNRQLARRLLADRLDRLLNGQQAVAAQQELIQQRRRQRSQDQRRRRRDRKQQWRDQRDAETAEPGQREDCGRSEDTGPRPP